MSLRVQQTNPGGRPTGRPPVRRMTTAYGARCCEAADGSPVRHKHVEGGGVQCTGSSSSTLGSGGDKAEGVPDSAQFITTRDRRRQRGDKTRDSGSLMEPRNFTGGDNRRGRGNYQGDPPRRPTQGKHCLQAGRAEHNRCVRTPWREGESSTPPMNGPPTPPPPGEGNREEG